MNYESSQCVTISVANILNYNILDNLHKYVSFIGIESTETYMIRSNHIILFIYVRFCISTQAINPIIIL